MRPQPRGERNGRHGWGTRMIARLPDRMLDICSVVVPRHVEPEHRWRQVECDARTSHSCYLRRSWPVLRRHPGRRDGRPFAPCGRAASPPSFRDAPGEAPSGAPQAPAASAREAAAPPLDPPRRRDRDQSATQGAEALCLTGHKATHRPMRRHPTRDASPSGCCLGPIGGSCLAGAGAYRDVGV
jgi:hypothetical protein